MPKVTCYCSAYPFPHRLLGGKCTHASAAEWYQTNRGDICHGCKNRTSEYGRVYCSVIDGYRDGCPAVREALIFGKIPK